MSELDRAPRRGHLGRLVRDHEHGNGSVAAGVLQPAQVGREEKLGDESQAEEGPQRCWQMKGASEWGAKDEGDEERHRAT